MNVDNSFENSKQTTERKFQNVICYQKLPIIGGSANFSKIILEHGSGSKNKIYFL